MKTKSIVKPISLVLFFAIASPTFAELKDPVVTETTTEHVRQLEQRLEEIKSMDMRKLSKQERKELRGEVRAIKKELAAVSGGVYLSVGAIIIIALLLILLL